MATNELRAQTQPEEGGWFARTMAIEPRRERITVAGAGLETFSWGEESAPAVMLAHGFAAHAGWWSFVAPMLAEGRRVVAFTFSGNGRSDWRERYTLDIHKQELGNVAAALGLFDAPAPPILFAHSFGGFPALRLVAEDPARWGGFALIDTMLEDTHYLALKQPARRERQLHASRETLLARFKLRPDQDCPNPDILDYVASSAINEVQTGDGRRAWSWGTDPNLFVDFEGRGVEPLLARISCPFGVVMGANSELMTPAVLAAIDRSVPPGTPVVSIPEAGHHVMLDRPLALTAVLRTFLAVWGR